MKQKKRTTSIRNSNQQDILGNQFDLIMAMECAPCGTRGTASCGFPPSITYAPLAMKGTKQIDVTIGTTLKGKWLKEGIQLVSDTHEFLFWYPTASDAWLSSPSID